MKSMQFFVDHMLGSLCRWIRIMGFDAEYAPLQMDDGSIVKKCTESSLVLLTRDRELSRRLSGSVLMASLNVHDQIRQFIELYSVDRSALFTRCTECNGVLQRIAVSPDLGLPARVAERFDHVDRCSSCGKLYWEGDHYSNILRTLTEIGVLNADNSR